MKPTLVFGALVALAASSHAVLIDDFSTGTSNSGYITGVVGSTFSATTAASVLGGQRAMSFLTTANPNAEDFRMRCVTTSGTLMFTNGIELDGVGGLSYGAASALNADFSASPLFKLTVAANDLPNVATLTLTSSTFGTVTRTLNLPTTTFPQIATFDFTGAAALADVDSIAFSFDFSPSGDFAVTRFEAVPEPVSVAALAIGVGGLVLRRRRR